jgi:hypothetical protein
MRPEASPGKSRRRRRAGRTPVAVACAASLGLLAVSCPKIVDEGRGGALLRAAACTRKITPVVGENHSDPIYMGGFDNDRTALSVHDDLWARGIVLERGETKIALVTLDVVGYFHNEVETIRSLVDPALGFDSITVSSTHNHEGPDTMGLWGPDELTSGADLGYLDFVNDQVVGCIEDANAALASAAIKFATGSTVGASLPPWPDLVADGKVLEELHIPLPDGGVIDVEGDAGPIINPSLPVFQIRRYAPLEDRLEELFDWLVGWWWRPFPDLQPLREVVATVVNYASHPESLGSDNRAITADFPHYLRESLERRYGGVAIYVSADLGVLQGPLDVDVPDAETGEPVPRRTFAFAERMGELLAERAIWALHGERRWSVRPELAVTTQGPFTVEVENPFFVFLGLLGVFGRRPVVFVGDIGVVESEVQAIRIGPATLAVTPNELDPQIGNLYRDAMGGAEHRFVVGLGNDEIGYQMPASKFNPSCFACSIEVLTGNEEACDFYDTLDCSTVFINNIGPSADPQLREAVGAALEEVAP